jgi:predicted secreted protein
VRGKDIPAIAQLTGRIQTMSIARVGYDLSRETREKFEGEVTAQAIARYRGKAAEVSKQFGFANYVIREVQVTTDEPGGQEMPMMRARVSAAPMADEPLPTQPGKGQVSATVSGTVQMLR